MAGDPVASNGPRGIASSAPEFNARLRSARKRLDLKVFLCGAAIERHNPPPPESREAALRYRIMQLLVESGCEVILGEDAEFYHAARDVLKAKVTYAHHELLLAARHADVTVVFPCSAGSFAELGMFAAAAEITRKLIVVIDDKDEYREGYIANGPALMAEYEGTAVEFLPYENVDAVWRFLLPRLDAVAMRRIKDEIFTGR